MRSTIIETANMCRARANASNDALFASLAATVVILGNIPYCELDPTVWDKSVYDEAVIGSSAGERGLSGHTRLKMKMRGH